MLLVSGLAASVVCHHSFWSAVGMTWKFLAGFNSCWLDKKHLMIRGTHGHLLNLRMQSLVGDANLFVWNSNGFNVGWIQPLLDSSFVGFNLWWIQGWFIQWEYLLVNCCWRYIELMSSVAGFHFYWIQLLLDGWRITISFARFNLWWIWVLAGEMEFCWM